MNGVGDLENADDADCMMMDVMADDMSGLEADSFRIRSNVMESTMRFTGKRLSVVGGTTGTTGTSGLAPFFLQEDHRTTDAHAKTRIFFI